ncbi:hypothetical protein VM1G_09711 [Cytospora mali]|uniref:PD-(D/E)XK nuclease-like domain-containing protein n=1 Tax=Cytospora mali TaxID=578113 RepID=A0A194WCY5_CYTMA|nr:hypothetical protein VM1G_09711 [Valsa mali]
MVSQARIQAWLNAVRTDHIQDQEQAKDRGQEQDTPPATRCAAPPGPFKFQSRTQQLASISPIISHPTLQSHPSPAAKNPRTLATSSLTIKKASDLELLRKPVLVRQLGSNPVQHLPVDVQGLYLSLRRTALHRSFIPSSVRRQVEDLLPPGDPDDSWFRDDSSTTNHTSSRSELELYRLHEICTAAAESVELERYEDAWNVLIHQPLLKLALEGEEEEEEEGQDQEHHHKVTSEYVASATIAGPWIPRVKTHLRRQDDGSSDSASVLACSVTGSSAGGSSDASYILGDDTNPGTSPASPSRTRTRATVMETLEQYQQLRDNIDVATMHSKPGSKKVDFAIVLSPRESSPLSQAVRHAASISAPIPTINQSTYPPLRFRPIAVAIESKTTTASADPIVQIGFWTAAWHRRMEDISAELGGGEQREGRRIITLPLICIVNHEWSVYFAVDRGSSIEMLGPVSMGGTQSIDSAYILLANLRALRDWIKTMFATFIHDWVVTRERNDS